MRSSLFTWALATACAFSPLLQGNEVENPFRIHKDAAKTAAVGAPWSAERHQLLLNKSDAVRNELFREAQSSQYPISQTDIENLFASKQTIPFFAYSSLIDKESSASKAISQEAVWTHRPAIGFGIARTFNRAMDPTVAANFGSLLRNNDVAILNAFEKEDAVTNGVVLQLSAQDLSILCKREVGYNLVPVLVAYWDEALETQTDPEILLAYTLIAPSSQEPTEFTNPFVNPIPGYVAFLQKGIKEMGKDYEAMWWSTTYLADQKTPISEMAYQYIDCRPALK